MKKHITTILISLSFVVAAEGQSSTDNYVKVYKALRPTKHDLSTLNHKDSVVEAITYYDRLGREIQSVSRRSSPLANDIVSFSMYDDFGKKTISYLPYIANQSTGAIVSNPLPDQIAFYINLFGQANGEAALSESVLEHSELGRLLIQGAPGDSWQASGTHTIKKDYLTNAGTDVYLIKYNSVDGSVSVRDVNNVVVYYTANSLSCTKTTDEETNDVLEYVDKEGRTVCKKVKAPGGLYASTYYVYDDLGNLAVVVPPESVNRIVNGN